MQKGEDGKKKRKKTIRVYSMRRRKGILIHPVSLEWVHFEILPSLFFLSSPSPFVDAEEDDERRNRRNVYHLVWEHFYQKREKSVKELKKILHFLQNVELFSPQPLDNFHFRVSLLSCQSRHETEPAIFGQNRELK